MNRLAIAAGCAGVILSLISAFEFVYAQEQLRRAAQIRVAACQMLPDRQLWDQFECSRAFEEAQR